jgi:hypothetical protein
MTAKPCKQFDWFPTHCCLCVQRGHYTPAKWIISRGQGRKSYLACDEHRDEVERNGVNLPKKRAQPL